MKSYSYLGICFQVLLLFSVSSATAQNFFFGEEPVTWENNRQPVLPKDLDNYENAGLLIIEDHSQFYFYAANNEKIVRKLLIKITDKRGLAAMQAYKLPESFDYAHDACLYKQGRRSKIDIPFIKDFHLNKLAARKTDGKKWTALPLEYKYQTIKWISNTGEFTNDDAPVFKFGSLEEGDVLELYYELQFNANYGSNLFYLNGRYPKLSCDYEFIYKINKYTSAYSYLLPVYIPDSVVTRSTTAAGGDYIINTDKIKMTGLKAINYPANSYEGRTLPHVFIDFSFYRVVTNSYSDPTGKVYEYALTRARNFEWMVIKDTTNRYTKIYTKQSATLHKFVSTLPPIAADSTHKTFFKALCDTLNNFRYITINQLFYNESNLYEVSSADHLLKRRLVGSGWKVCEDILNDNNIFYYEANVQDRRYGDHSIYYRAHYGYERSIIAIPSGDSYIYFIPRYNGVRYHLGELPFYYEGCLAALKPKNFQENTKDKDDKFFKFIKTHKGTFNENTRTENATAKISLDSLSARLTIKESLCGQFSTVLRHLYLNNYIDSTISPHYFKKCTQKPRATETKIKLSSNMTEFPFRYNFNCNEKLTLSGAQRLDLTNWFSFTLSKNILPEAPSHDYYLDFEFSDSYNFLLEFDKPVEITNSAAFSKKINNDLVDLESEIIKNSETSYLLRLKLVMKDRKIPQEKTDELLALAATLDELNNFSLLLFKK